MPEFIPNLPGHETITPSFALEISVKDGALYVHPTGQPTLRLWAESETDFFLKEVDAQITFVRSADGKPTGLVLHQNGQNANAPKTK